MYIFNNGVHKRRVMNNLYKQIHSKIKLNILYVVFKNILNEDI
jgi:hypothetical protein